MDRRGFVAASGASALAALVPAPVVAGNLRQPTGYLRTNWSHDPFSYGSYSFVAKGSRQRDRRRLEAPIDDRVYFAGEAVYPWYNSTVHSAHESGVRTAGFVAEAGHGSVAVIGAGMSGLSAAHAMTKAGADVTVFEGRDRLGGRIWTSERLGVALDLGASWIHGATNNPVNALAESAGQARVETDGSHVSRGTGGRAIPDHDLPDWLQEVAEVQHTAGAGSDEINVSAYLLQDDYDGPELVFPGGYAGVFDALAGDYAVRLGQSVRQVRWDDGGAWLALQTGGELRFDAIVVTVPLGVLKRGDIAFVPGLPDSKQSAIGRLGMGTLDKVYLQFEAPFWDTDVTWITTPENGLAPGYFNQWLNMYRFTGAPIILAFNGGPPALELAQRSDADLVQMASETLTKAYPF